MNLTTARSIIRAATDSGADTDRYSNTDVDVAMLLVGNDFVSRTGCTSQLNQIAFLAAAAAVDLSVLATSDGFRDEFLDEASIVESADYPAAKVEDGLEILAWADLRKRRGRDGTSAGTPTVLAFRTTTLAHLYPPAAYAGTLDLWWRPPFVTIDPGTATPDVITINIDDDLLYPVLVHGAAVIVQMTDPEAIEKALRSGAYDAHVQRCAGRGGRSPRSFTRTTLADLEEKE